MPNPKQHQQKADDNRAFLNSLSSTGPAEWIAVVAFYTAVHLIEKLLAYRSPPLHSKNHEERNDAVRKHYKAIQKEYHELFNLSLVARYSTRGKFTLAAATAKTLIIDNYLVTIERFVAQETLKYAPPPAPPQPPAPPTTPPPAGP